jgi:hypothetical protein
LEEEEEEEEEEQIIMGHQCVTALNVVNYCSFKSSCKGHKKHDTRECTVLIYVFYGNSTDMFLILSIICVKRHGNHGIQPEVDEMDENHQRKGFKEHISKYDLFKYAI